MPPVPGAELAVTSNEMFHLDALPKRALVVGGGYIACEFACILNGLGVKVTQYYRGAQILRGFDDEARAHVAAGMVAHGIDIRLQHRCGAAGEGAGRHRAVGPDGTAAEFDLVLYATGRKPNVDGSGAGGAGRADRSQRADRGG